MRTLQLSCSVHLHSYVTILQAMLPTLSQIKDVMKCVEPLAVGFKTLASGPSAAKLSAAFATLDKYDYARVGCMLLSDVCIGVQNGSPPLQTCASPALHSWPVPLFPTSAALCRLFAGKPQR